MYQFFDSVAHSIATSGPLGGIFVVFWYILCCAFVLLIYLPLLLVGWIVSFAWPVLLPAALIISVWKWEFFARWYFLLTPHPAKSMVQQAIRSGVEFDAQAFADILRNPPLSGVGRDVRNEQAAKLAAMARMSNAELRRAAGVLRRQVEEQAKYQAAHGELLDAMMEQQLAKARADAYAKAQEFWSSRRKT
jgi:hypothetical protein